ncbi:MAG: cytochrome b/b6 domain-containing protein, partial [Sphingomonadales bacterium]|nr:cytochrome b/b6 domain-containing protein [Sphingomonadales bacterium]
MNDQPEQAINDNTRSYLRFPLSTRLLHWTAAGAIFALLWSGLWVLNIHPRLYWGDQGYFGAPAIAEIVADTSADETQYSLHIGGLSLNVTGIMGRGNGQPYIRLFNYPQGFDFGGNRALHFTAAWVLVIGWFYYVYHLIASGRLRNTWLPTRAELHPRRIGQDIINHLKFRRARGEAAKKYNILQKFSYLLVMFVLLPLVFLTGLTMSNSITTAWPFLFDLFGGRQSARTLHFVFAFITVLFIVIHVLQLFV